MPASTDNIEIVRVGQDELVQDALKSLNTGAGGL